MPGYTIRLLIAVVSLAYVISCAAEAAAPAAADFERDVRPILVKRSVRCPGGKKREGGLALDHKASAFQGGDGGPVLVPGKSLESRLFRYAAGLEEDMQMPPEGLGKPLTPA